jgi:hypothetical protein
MPTPHPRPWHRDSVFGDGPRRPLDREQRARVTFLLRAHARAGRLPAKQEWVGVQLLKHVGRDGQCDPSHAALAREVGCGERTVRRAIIAMKNLGLLLWQTRIVRAGWRAEQTSSAYEFTPVSAVTVLPRCGGQSGRETKSLINQRLNFLPATSDRDREVARDALARRRAVVEKLLMKVTT